jgi:hypothetical protein
MTTPRAPGRLAIALIVGCLALQSSFGSAGLDERALPPLDIDPPVTVDILLGDLAEGSRAASEWLLELEEGSLALWVWRVPCDPDVHAVFADNTWVATANVGRLTRDLGESMRRNVEYYAPFFDLVLDPSWSERARAFADTLSGVEQDFVGYSLVERGTDASITVEVTSHYIDLVRLEVLEGTFVQVSRLLDP